MARYVTLIAAQDEYDTELGFILKGCPSFDGLAADRKGSQIAHDIIEHQNGAKAMGPVWDELEALGGVWYCRGQYGFPDNHRNYHSPASNMASDITRMWQDWSYTDDCYLGPKGLTVGSKSHLSDEDFLEIIEIARQDIPKEYNDPDESHDGLELYLTLALHRMRSGFNKASKRFYREHDGMFAYRQYQAIIDAVSNALRDVHFEGQEFRLSYGDGEASCNEIWDQYS